MFIAKNFNGDNFEIYTLIQEHQDFNPSRFILFIDRSYNTDRIRLSRRSDPDPFFFYRKSDPDPVKIRPAPQPCFDAIPTFGILVAALEMLLRIVGDVVVDELAELNQSHDVNHGPYIRW